MTPTITMTETPTPQMRRAIVEPFTRMARGNERASGALDDSPMVRGDGGINQIAPQTP